MLYQQQSISLVVALNHWVLLLLNVNGQVIWFRRRCSISYESRLLTFKTILCPHGWIYLIDRKAIPTFLFLRFLWIFLPFIFGMPNDYFSYLCTVLGTKVADFKLVNWVQLVFWYSVYLLIHKPVYCFLSSPLPVFLPVYSFVCLL